MVKLELKEKTYNLPTNFSEVNIDKYQKVTNIEKDLKDIDKIVKIISILTGIEESDVKDINLEQIKFINNSISFIFKNEKTELVDRFELDGVKYGFEKNLSDIPFGEYIDLEEFSKPKEANDNLHILMAILYRPIKKFKKRNLFSYLRNDNKEYKIEEYNSDEVMKRAELFKEKLTMEKVLGAMVFFSLIKTGHILLMSGYSLSKTKKKMMEIMKGMNLKPEMKEVDG